MSASAHTKGSSFGKASGSESRTAPAPETPIEVDIDAAAGRDAEPAPSASERSVDDMFVSPRVVDQRTFLEFSATLRSLMEQAAAERSAIAAALESIRGDRDEAKSSADRLSKRLDAAGKLLPTLDERVQRGQAILRESIDEDKLRKLVGERVDAIAASSLASLEQRVEQVVSETATRVESLERSLAGAVEEAAARSSALRDEIRGLLDEHTDAATRLREELSGELPSMGERLEATKMEASETLERIEQRLASVGEDAEARSKGIEQRLNERVERIKADLAVATGPVVMELQLLVKRGGELLGRDVKSSEGDAVEGSLGDLVARAESAVADASAAAEEAAAARKAAVGAVGSIRDAAEQGREKVEELDRLREELETAVERAEERAREVGESIVDRRRELDKAMASLESGELSAALEKLGGLDAALARVGASGPAIAEATKRGEELGDALDKLQAKQRRIKTSVDAIEGALSDIEKSFDMTEIQAGVRIDELKAMIAEPLNEIGQDVQEVGAWLNELVERARETSADVESKLGRLSDERTMVGTLSHRLEPWRELIDGAKGDGLPEALEKKLEMFRKAIDAELSTALDKAGAADSRLTKLESELKRIDGILVARSKQHGGGPSLPERRHFRRDDAGGR